MQSDQSKPKLTHLPQNIRITNFLKQRVEIYKKKMETLNFDKLNISEEGVEKGRSSTPLLSNSSMDTNYEDSQDLDSISSMDSETGSDQFYTPKRCALSPIFGTSGNTSIHTPPTHLNKRPRTDEEMTQAPVRTSFPTSGSSYSRRELLMKSLTEDEQELVNACPER